MSNSNPFRVSLAFVKLPIPDLLSRGYAVAAGIPSNPAFANPPVDPAVLKADLDKLSAATGEALDGGKKAIAEKNKQREVVITMLRKLAHFVEVNCNRDMPTFLASGFEPKSASSGSPQPLDQPVILNVDHGKTGEFEVKIKAVKRARHYEVRSGALPVGSTAPTPSTSWTSQTFPSARAAAVINGLTPGTTYAIQVRAYGKLGFTAWSD